MPEMGESVTEGTVLEWAVAVGDSVAEGDTVVEVSTDKVDAEVPAPAAGTITKLLVEPDEVVKVGQPLAEMAAGRRRPGSGPLRNGRSAGAAPEGSDPTWRCVSDRRTDQPRRSPPSLSAWLQTRASTSARSRAQARAARS